MSDQSDWSELQAELDPETEDRLVRDGVAELDRILMEREDAFEGVEKIVAAFTSGPPTLGGFDSLNTSLTNFLDSGSANVLTWVGDDPSRLHRVTQLDAPRAISLVRRIYGAFGRRILRLQFARNGLFDEWESCNWWVSYDDTVEAHRMLFEVQKINGERVRIEARADSFMDLSRFTLAAILELGSRDAFSPEVREEFLGSLDQVGVLLRPPPPPPES